MQRHTPAPTDKLDGESCIIRHHIVIEEPNVQSQTIDTQFFNERELRLGINHLYMRYYLTDPIIKSNSQFIWVLLRIYGCTNRRIALISSDPWWTSIRTNHNKVNRCESLKLLATLTHTSDRQCVRA